MDKAVKLSTGAELWLRATALTPRLYRHKFGRDLFSDMTMAAKNKGDVSMHVLSNIEDLAYIMARQYNPAIPESEEEWLDGLPMSFATEICVPVIDLWGMNQKTTSTSKKK